MPFESVEFIVMQTTSAWKVETFVDEDYMILEKGRRRKEGGRKRKKDGQR